MLTVLGVVDLREGRLRARVRRLRQCRKDSEFFPTSRGGWKELTAFVVIESRVANPLLPLRVVLNRSRGGAFLATVLSAAGLYGMFLFLTFYLQGILKYSALEAGFAFLPFSVGIIIGATITGRVLARAGPRIIMTAGMFLAALGLFWFTQIGLDNNYFLHVLPAQIVVSIGMGIVFVTVSSTALIGVKDDDSGVASALINTSQQVGGSLGTALLNTIAAIAAAGYLTTHHAAGAQAAADVRSYQLAFLIAGVMLAAGGVLTLVLVNAGKAALPVQEAEPSPQR
ncbi:MAG: hypothetical protein QG671_787 [Actinomycetota bacterium]|nr:hypothetical protein [Actinomycetota bacterium]